MEKDIKVLYENKEYFLDAQELDRVVALASRKIRRESENAGLQIGLGAFSVNMAAEKGIIKVFRNGYRSRLYEEMKTELIFAIESGMLENYEQRHKEIRQELWQVQQQEPEVVVMPVMQRQIQIIPLTSPAWRMRFLQDNIFRPHFELD